MPRSPLLMLLVFAFTLFASATLLFLVEPMVGKMILPLLGGTPAVWNTCMVFFQAILLAGYLYAHLTTTWLGPRRQAAVHLGVLLLPFLLFPLTVRPSMLATNVESPVFPLLFMLLVCVGLPMFAVCTSAPLLQKWFADTNHPAARDPYFLYGASNLGSMLALFAYPLWIEPHLAVRTQTFDWAIGYGLLVALTAVCAWFLWRSPQPALAGLPVKPPEPLSTPGKKQHITTTPRTMHPTDRPRPAVSEGLDHPLGGTVTWGRRLRWVLLAAVPSSLMLGVTTYITTDIAAIPLLWVLPLALYLLTFIIVFARIPPRVQSGTLGAVAIVGGIGLAAAVYHIADKLDRPMLRFVALFPLAAACLSYWIFKLKDDALVHKLMILAMPLLVLLVLFLMEAEIKPRIGYSIALHLVVLFVVAMVCHGELARDRPDTGHLTEFYLWMSVGGVVGGLFNALVAPLVFRSIVEYSLALVGACLLLPPLGITGPPRPGTRSGRRLDMSLAGLFVCIGLVLIALRLQPQIKPEEDLQFDRLAQRPWGWEIAALVAGVGAGAWWALRAPREQRTDRWLDLVLPASLGVLVLGLSWGLTSDAVWPRVISVSDFWNRSRLGKILQISGVHLHTVLTLGLPAVLCYTFVERSLRFGLGVGAFLLALALAGGTNPPPVFQKRSFFGVLKVDHQQRTVSGRTVTARRLIHGTTMHGEQVLDDELSNEPSTYYHRSGPIGQVFGAYNTDPKRPYAVIGLGTGTMATYALPGQHVTFYDIDSLVRDLSFSEEAPLFTYIARARQRGAKLDLVLGDARVMLERQQLAPDEKYHLMVIDAFSSDAIPIHLITKEALQLYLARTADDAILCFHISNRYLDLRPVLANLAHELGLAALYESDDDESYPGKSRSSWVVLARHESDLAQLHQAASWNKEAPPKARAALAPWVGWPDPLGVRSGPALALFEFADQFKPLSTWQPLRPDPEEWKQWPPLDEVGVWTDDYSNLFSVFSW